VERVRAELQAEADQGARFFLGAWADHVGGTLWGYIVRGDHVVHRVYNVPVAEEEAFGHLWSGFVERELANTRVEDTADTRLYWDLRVSNGGAPRRQGYSHDGLRREVLAVRDAASLDYYYLREPEAVLAHDAEDRETRSTLPRGVHTRLVMREFRGDEARGLQSGVYRNQGPLAPFIEAELAKMGIVFTPHPPADPAR